MLIGQSRNAGSHSERCFAVAVLESLLDVERKECMRHPKSALLNHLPVESGCRRERAGKLDAPAAPEAAGSSPLAPTKIVGVQLFWDWMNNGRTAVQCIDFRSPRHPIIECQGRRRKSRSAIDFISGRR